MKHSARNLLLTLAVSVALIIDFFWPAAKAQATPQKPTVLKLSKPRYLLASLVRPFSQYHPATSRVYTVQTGDCLWNLAIQFYGNGLKWRKIYRDNLSVVGSDPNLIYPGQKLTIVSATQDVPVSPPVTVGGGDPPPSHDSVVNDPPPSAGANPLRDLNFSWERIDEGQDLGGNGPIYAIGTGVIVEAYDGTAGWPGGTYIVELVTSGPAAGRRIYFAEDITSNVQVGEYVNSGTIIGQLNGQAELGWASTIPQTPLAHDHYVEGQPTPEGQDFSNFLHSLVNGGSQGVGGAGPVVQPIIAGDEFHNLLLTAKYLVHHGYTPQAAVGIAWCIDGESQGNPESGSEMAGGLIGWTGTWPESEPMITGNASKDLADQLQALVDYNNSHGGSAGINQQSTVQGAADYYSENFERPLVPLSDVHPEFAATAAQLFAALGG